MIRAVLCGWLVALLLASCSWMPRAGPSGREVIAQAGSDGNVSFDVVKVDDAVIKVLQAQHEPPFHERFKKYTPSPELKIAVGDTVSVVIWEAGANGLFGLSLAEWSVPPGVASRVLGTPTSGLDAVSTAGQSVTAFASDVVTQLLGGAPGTTAETAPPGAPLGNAPGANVPVANAPLANAPLANAAAAGAAAANAAEGGIATANAILAGAAADRPGATAPRTGGCASPQTDTAGAMLSNRPQTGLNVFATTSRNLEELLQNATPTGRAGTRIPDQRVGSDGGISIPYAGRIKAAGHTPDEVQRTIEERLGPKALQPQVLVIIRQSIANSVAVSGECIRGQRVPLSPGGERLLDVIAAAGGTDAPPHEMFVQLSRGGITAAVPLATLIDNPEENIFAEPGDVLTLTRRPQTFSTFGATGKNTAITFDTDRLLLSEALAKAGGLLDDSADPRAVFLMRYEPVGLVRALGQPIATAARDGVSPVVYRLDLSDANSYPLAREFEVRDKDIIFVANAELAGIYKAFATLQNITGPVISGFVVCQYTKC